jgi:predicted DsbA family dithiol-disulfide isomerase
MQRLNKKTIQIDIVSDVACPWCYVGKKRLEKAISTLEKDYNFNVSFKPFQLDPNIPESGIDAKTYFNNKFGSSERTEEIFSHTSRAGASVGINFRFNNIPKAINTLPLHCILSVAKQEGNQLAVKQALLDAYMVQCIDLSILQNITHVLSPFGWDLAKVEKVVFDKNIRKEVENDIKFAQINGITGVPFFIINNKFGISGAQPSELFIQVFQSLKDEDFEQIQSNESCDISGNC